MYTAVTPSKITTASYPKGNVHLRKFFHEMKMKERCERCFICIGGCVTVSRVPGCRGRERGWTCILIAPPTTLGTPSPALPPLDNFQRPGNTCFWNSTFFPKIHTAWPSILITSSTTLATPFHPWTTLLDPGRHLQNLHMTQVHNSLLQCTAYKLPGDLLS